MGGELSGLLAHYRMATSIFLTFAELLPTAGQTKMATLYNVWVAGIRMNVR